MVDSGEVRDIIPANLDQKEDSDVNRRKQVLGASLGGGGLGKGNMAAIDELLATNFVFSYPPPGVTSDREGYKQTVTLYRTASPDMHYAVDDIVAEGDKVAVRWTGRGTHKGDLMGTAPTGKQVTITGISILRIAGGKIVEEWGEMNMLGALQQLGAFPPPGQA